MKVSIILPVWNLLDRTKKTIQDLYARTNYNNYTLTIIDNGSTDGTKEYLHNLKDKDPKIDIIVNDKNVMGNIAWNQAIKNTYDSDYFCFIQNDVLFTDNWLTKLVNTMQSNPKLGVVSPTPLGTNLCKESNFHEYAAIFMGEDRLVDKDGFHGCCYIVRKAVYEKLMEVDGYWIDEDFILLWSDLDFIERVEHVGFETRIAKDNIIYHIGAVSQKLLPEVQRNKYNSYDEIYFWSKWELPVEPYSIADGRIRHLGGMGMRLKRKKVKGGTI